MPTTSGLNEDASDNGNRNLWIILGSVLGTLFVAFTLGMVWIWRRRLQKRGVIPTRTVTPLDDAEFDSWRRPSEHNQRAGRYTVMPRKSSLSQVETSDIESTEVYIEKARTPRPTTPTRTYRQSYFKPPQPLGHRRSSSFSVKDRPPTPHSIRHSKKDEIETSSLARLSSPPSVTRPPRAAHVHYPSVSETSDFNFDFEKTELDLENFGSGARAGYNSPFSRL